MINKNSLEKRFSVGLCLNESAEDLQVFLERNRKWLNSVYFSLPLGDRFFSRESLVQEYSNSEDKLFTVLELLAQFGIRREMAINTWDLTQSEIDRAIRYCDSWKLQPEEIVCLRDYGDAFRAAFPNAEIKYSVNNPESDGKHITKAFHTLVAGKGLLRDMAARHHFLEQGYGITILLNNGCLSICNTACEVIHCHRYFEFMINKYGLDYTYALCSFFPSELQALLTCDPHSNRYKFKISNRPLGLNYTQQVLDSYLSLMDDYSSMQEDFRKMALFCTARPLAIRLQQVDLPRVREYKTKWLMELKNGTNRET